MKQFFTILLSAILSITTAKAQSFLDRLQTQTKGKGTVTVTQSADIDRLVNGTTHGNAAGATQKKPAESKAATVSGANTSARQVKTTANPTQHHTTYSTVKAESSSPKAEINSPKAEINSSKAELNSSRAEISSSKVEISSSKAEKSTPIKAEKAASTAEKATPRVETSTADAEVRIADPRPKVMGNSYKVNGYRVQAFAGGNTRTDKQKAQHIGNAIKDFYPDEPVYVHFYSPRWICRVGNYRTYEEAHKMLLELRELGYKQAIIVKGKITVQY